MGKVINSCIYCNKEYLVYSGKSIKSKYCSKTCKYTYLKGKTYEDLYGEKASEIKAEIKKKLTGELNPSFGKKWSDEKKQKQSDLIKTKVDLEYREQCSKGMKNKSISEETKNKRKQTIKYNTENGKIRKPISEFGRCNIGKASSMKFTDEYKTKFRKTMEDAGHWISIDKKDDWEFYRDISNWRSQPINNTTIGLEKLKEFNFFDSSSDSKNCIVRDHRFSRKQGFNDKVFPEIIRHPVNCQLISFSENIKKSKSGNGCSIRLEQLFEEIINYKEPYIEQLLCIKLINDYMKGERFVKQNYIK